MSIYAQQTIVEPRALNQADLSAMFEHALAAGGTLRDLLIALSTVPNRLIPGSVFREVIDACALRNAFSDILQSPQIVEALDAVWIGSQEGQTVVEFRFAQPQTLPQATPLGTVRLQINRTLTLIIDAMGGITLRPGDVTLRWLALKEPLLARIRHVTTREGEQDVLYVSAGHILSQTIPLAALSLPGPAAPPPAAPAITAGPAMAAAGALVVIVHHTPGRARFRVQSLYRNQAQKVQIEQHLAAQPGIRGVSASILTGTLLVRFDSSITPEEIEIRISYIVRGIAFEAPQPPGRRQPDWHLLDQAEVVRFWESSPQHGLDERVAAARLRAIGPNVLPEPQARSGLAIVLEQLQSLPVVLLGASALLSIFTGGLVDGAVILSVVLINAGIGYVTERWAEQTIASLSRGVQPPVRVVRGGGERTIASEHLVPGDLIVLKRGMAVPADARLLDTDHLTVDESALTGESVPVAKHAAPLSDATAPLGSRTNMIYRGTVVTGGSARALVVATGPATEAGQVQQLLAEARPPETPLQRQLRLLGGQLALLSLAVCGGVFGIGLLRGQGILAMLKTAISLAVAAIPEGLPTVATTTLALGLRRLEQQRILVRRLVAVETLGAVQYVCLDKTGTITLNQMTLVALFANMTAYGHHDSRFYCSEEPIDPLAVPDLAMLLRLAVLCSEVEIGAAPGGIQIKGTPTESALVQAALDAGIDVAALRGRHPLERMRLRSEQRGFMDTLHTGEDGVLLAVKGAPDQVLALCGWQARDGAVCPLGAEDRARIMAENERMAGRALRVLGVAYQREDSALEQNQQLIWVGLVGITDPPRQGMQELVAQFRRAGIHPIMITGDQSATAHAVARQIGLRRDGHLEGLDATRLEELQPDVLRALAQRVDIFSRVSPAHKLRIVQALQRAGHVVAMTGDGINDGPALRAADIGIAMGKDGSEIAQEVADIIIRDDHLESIITAIAQGRTIYDDIKKAVHFILASNTSEILVTLIATAAGLGEPLTPIQLLWVNLMTDIFPELALGVEPPEFDVMGRPPRDPQQPMISRRDLQHIGLEGSLITACTLAAYGWGLARYGAGPRAGTLAFTSLTAAQLLYAISCRSEPHSIFDATPFPPNPYIPLAVGGGIALQGIATLAPGLRAILGVSRLGATDWAITAALAVVPLLVNESAKLITRSSRPEDER